MEVLKLEKINCINEARMDLNSRQLENGHILLVGVTGCAKTTSALFMIQSQLNNGISSFTIDTTDGLTDDHIPSEFVKNNKHRVNVINVFEDGIGIGLLDRKTIKVNGKLYDETDGDIADRVVSVVGHSLDFGPKQKNVLYDAVISALSIEDDGFNYENKYAEMAEKEMAQGYIGLNCVCYQLKEQDGKDTATAVLEKLTRIVSRNLFSNSNIDWNDILYGKPTFTNFELSGLAPDIKKLVSEMILLDFWLFITLNGTTDKPCIAWLDEIQKLNLRENSTVSNMLALGRKFGINLWMCTQVLREEPIKSAISKISMASTKFFFKPSDMEVKFIAKNYGIDKAEELLKLNKGECLAMGKFVNMSGKPLSSKCMKVKFPKM